MEGDALILAACMAFPRLEAFALEKHRLQVLIFLDSPYPVYLSTVCKLPTSLPSLRLLSCGPQRLHGFKAYKEKATDQ